MLVTAAFIGPGTVTTASKAGAEFGLALSWAVMFSIAATIVLQEMAARLGLVTRQGLGEAIRSSSARTSVRVFAGLIVAVAIGVGNAAYQTGNVVGAALGLSLIVGGSLQWWAFAIGMIAFGLLFSGRYQYVEAALIGLVLVMSSMFLATAMLVHPEPADIIQGCLHPKLPNGSWLTVVALIGTTVVPYNLFLHASSVSKKWTESTPLKSALQEARIDIVSAVLLGGLVTLAIVLTAAAAFHGNGGIANVADMARQLEPLLGGSAAKMLFAGGLLAAGLTSAITAPLAAAFAISGAMGWESALRSWRFRTIWMLVLVVGTTLAALGLQSPQITILIAQAANGMLLPLITMFLLFAVNSTQLMGQHKNNLVTNLAGLTVVLVTLLLGGTTLYKLCVQ